MQRMATDEVEVSTSSTHLSSYTSGALEVMVANTPACRFEVLEFFVSWQGVLTVAYTGFPDSLLELKQNIAHQYPGLMKENPGSKWPKTSIACLHDNKRLTMEDLKMLRNICSEENMYLTSTTPPIEVDKLSIVFFANCCLEKTFLSTDMSLSFPADRRAPHSDQLANVRAVLNEFQEENLNNYYFHASKDGNRAAHYRGFKAGVTLVHHLANIPKALSRFRQRVEEELPNMYDWFSEDSLHITIRAML